MDQVDRVARAVSRHEVDFARDNGRDECGHRLSEQMAQRQQIQKPDGRERAHVFPIFLDAFVDRFQVREDVAMRDGDAFRVASRAGSEQNFREVVRRGGRERIVRFRAHEVAHGPDRAGEIGRGLQRLPNQESACVHDTSDSLH